MNSSVSVRPLLNRVSVGCYCCVDYVKLFSRIFQVKTCMSNEKAISYCLSRDVMCKSVSVEGLSLIVIAINSNCRNFLLKFNAYSTNYLILKLFWTVFS
jgi:hypothetical protein